MHACMLKTYRHKERAFLIRSKAVGNAHNTDKSRPHNTWAFANLLLVLLIELPTFWSANKSQTRKSYMSNNLICRPLGNAHLHHKSRNNQIAVQSYCFFLTYANKIVTK